MSNRALITGLLAFAMAETMFTEALTNLEEKNARPVEGSEKWKELKASIVPPYDPGKFPGTFSGLEGIFKPNFA